MNSGVQFYEKPVLLHRDTHRKTRIAPERGDGFAFATKAHSIALTGQEFGEACKEYAVVFARDNAGNVAPIALLGLREGENLFVKKDGNTTVWDGKYIPAFVRRYPFVLAQLQGGQLGVCIDQAFSGLSETEGEPLFDSEGRDTPFLQNAMEFLNRYQADHHRTAQFSKRLLDLDLLTEMNAKVELKQGGSFTLNGLFVVDEKKLLALPDDKALEVYRSGEMSWIYAHLMSLTNLNRLMERLSTREATA